MKNLLLFGVLALCLNSYGQSKKQQIVALNYSIDSLNVILSITRNKAAKDIGELNTTIEGLNTTIEGLNTTIEDLSEEISDLKRDLSELESSVSTLEKDKSKLALENEKFKTDLEEISKKNSDLEAKMELYKTTLRDSISNIHSSSNIISSNSPSNSSDFLNNYFFDQIPLPNNSFSLVLTKIMYRTENNYDPSMSYSELLNLNAFNFWVVEPGLKRKKDRYTPPEEQLGFNDIVIPKNFDYFNSKLPKIEILKNKLLTLNYNDGSEESFLFNVKQSENINQRKTLQFALDIEEVENDYDSRDVIFWNIWAIENECYLVLDAELLNRLKLKFLPGGVIETSYGQTAEWFNYSGATTGDGLYLSRKKDVFMETSAYVSPSNLTFLFKLQ